MVAEDGPAVPNRVFITGALGFIGRALAARYRALGSDVCGVDLRASADDAVVAGDLCLSGPWQDHARDADLVIHTAAVVSNVGDARAFWDLNVLGTRHALDAAVAGGARRFVHFSSVRAFSDRDFPDGVTEAHPVRPDGRHYVETKIASEQVVLQAHAAREIVCTIVRPGDVYGPGSRPWTVLPVEMMKARRFVLPAMGRGIFSPIFIENLLDGVTLAAGAENARGEVFTLTDGAGVQTREFFGYYARMLGQRSVVVLPTAVARTLGELAGRAERLRGRESEASAATVDYLARRGTYSIDKARRVLGYRPRIELAEGMRRTEVWLRAQRLL